MRARGMAMSLLGAALLLVACGGGGHESASSSSAEGSSSRSTTPPTTASSSTSAAGADLALAVDICTQRMAQPDELVSDAAHAAKDGTRTVSEIADAFREAQNAAEGIAGEAEAGQLPNLAAAVQEYADVLGRARVAGDVGLTEILDAREAINTACYLPAGTAQSS